MTRKRWFPPIAVLMLATSFALAEDGPARRPFSPAEKPLAVLRVPSPGAVEALLTSTPAEAAGVGTGRDWPVRPPGLPRLPGIRNFFARLAEDGAEDFWFCLPDLNRSAMGWRLPVPDPARAADTVRDMLLVLGMDISRVLIAAEPLPNGTSLILVASDRKTIELVRGGPTAKGTKSDGVWRPGLEEFMNRADGGVGVWLDPRPLSGLSAMFLGFDPRARLAAAGVDLPSSLSAWVGIADGVPGFSLRLDGLYRPGTLADGSGQAWSGAFVRPPAAAVEFRLSGLTARLDGLAVPPLPPGVDWRRLVPDNAALGVWAGPGGDLRWALRGTLRPGALDGFRRLGLWLDLLASGPDAGFKITRDEGSATSATCMATFPGISLLAGVDRAEGGNETLFLTNAGSGDLPRLRPDGVKSGPAAEMAWDIALDAGMRKDAVALLSRLELPPSFAPDFWASLVRSGEQGRLTLDNGSLILESPRGSAIWLGLAMALRLEPFVQGLRPDDSALAAARLRFLLDAAWQSRYRTVAGSHPVPAPLPASLEQIALADPDGAAWLDNALPAFPGEGKPNAIPMRHIASGSALNGYSYHLQPNNGWFIVAKPIRNTLPVLRIDRDGFMTELPPGEEWRPRQAGLSEFLGGF